MNYRGAVTLAAGICALLANQASALGTEHYGSWVVVSTEVSSDFANDSLSIEHRVSRTGSASASIVFKSGSGGDGGDSVSSDVSFSSASNGNLRVLETVNKYDAVWELDPSGGVGFRQHERRVIEWDGTKQVEISSYTVVSLVRYGSDEPVKVTVTGMVVPDFEATPRQASKKEAIVVGQKWRREAEYYQVKFSDGSLAYAERASISILPE